MESDRLKNEDNQPIGSGGIDPVSSNAVALTEEELQSLIEAEQSLQAAPWLVWDDGDIGTAYPVQSRIKDRSTGEVEVVDQESLWLFNGYSPTSDQVVKLRNAFPGLLARLRAAEQRAEELEAELEGLRPPF